MSPAQAKLLARRLYEGGWDRASIRRYLSSQGVNRSPESIRRWTDTAYDERVRLARRPRPRPVRTTHSIAYRLQRLQALHSEGLSYGALTIVARVDFGDAFTEDRLRYAMQRGRYPEITTLDRKAAHGG